MPRHRHHPRSADEIRRILDALDASGLSRRQFAADHDIPLSTLHSWLAKTPRDEAAAAASPHIIPVGSIEAAGERPVSMEIELPGGEVIRLHTAWRAQDLRVVLTELRRC